MHDNKVHITAEALAILRRRARRELDPETILDLLDGTYLVELGEEQFRLLASMSLTGETASDCIIRMEGIRHGYN
jgi:hypothetical protein